MESQLLAGSLRHRGFEVLSCDGEVSSILEFVESGAVKIAVISCSAAHSRLPDMTALRTLHLTHPDDAVRARTSQYLCELVDFCAELGGKVVVFGSPKQRNILDGVTPRDAWNWATAAFREPVLEAEKRAVTICFEPMSSAETNFINTAAEAIQFIQQFSSPNFKILLDVKALCAEPKPIPQIIRDSAPHFAYFHAYDKTL